jgi:hypothetical protein
VSAKGPIVTKRGPGTFAEADYYEVPEELNVYSWCPSPDGTGPATQVHLHIGKPPSPVLVVRFKGPKTLDAIIQALNEHRIDVWGKP